MAQVFAVHPGELFGIEDGVRFGDGFERERAHHFFERKYFFRPFAARPLRRRPAEQGEEVEQGFREDALFPIGAHGRCAVTLAQALPVRAEDERQVRERGRRRAQRLVHQDLLRGIREVVGASDDVSHPHVEVIGHHAQVIGGVPVRA